VLEGSARPWKKGWAVFTDEFGAGARNWGDSGEVRSTMKVTAVED
jgi:hypothetical protein